MSEPLRGLVECNIPMHMWQSIRDYIENGYPPGSFLEAVIDNNLFAAGAHADDINRHHLWDYVNWFYNYAPSPSWGYEGATAAWCARLAKQRQKEDDDAE